MAISERIYNVAPSSVKNLLVTIFDLSNLNKRRRGKYHIYKKDYKKFEKLDFAALQSLQSEKYTKFIEYLIANSDFYRQRLSGIPDVKNLSRLDQIPVLEKEELKKNLDSIITITPSKGLKAFTGGTTGKPIQVVFTKDNFRERVAILDNFREKYGFYYGKSKVAWFSGRKILSKNDEHKKRFWRNDPMMRIRYYSTFHLSKANIPFYIRNLNKFRPEFFSGFPSALYEIAEYMEANKLKFTYPIKGIFTTSETLLPHMRSGLERTFNCRVFDQYASAEGAPFIYDCEQGKMHYCMPSGIIEVLDDQNKPAKEGELIVSSFTSYGTPLLRYRIGDYGVLAEGTCNCGLHYPIFERLEGRATDFIYSEKRGKVFNSQVGDCVKADIPGLINYQVIQESLTKLSVDILITEDFESKSQEKIVAKLRDRVGSDMEISVRQVSDLTREKSGKVRLIVNHAQEEIAKNMKQI